MRMIAPLSRLAIWAKAIISMRSDAERTAIFPVPPIELLIIPDPIAVSTGYNPTSFPIKADASPIATTEVKLRRMNCQVIAFARVVRSIKERPIPARTAWVRLVIMTWLNMTTQFSKGFGTALNAFRINTMIIMKA